MDKKVLKSNLLDMLDVTKGHQTVNGYSILHQNIYKFDKTKLYVGIEKVIEPLMESELHKLNEGERVTLPEIVSFKGNPWLKIESQDDFDTVDMLFAAANAYGFIKCNEEILDEEENKLVRDNKVMNKQTIHYMATPESRKVASEKWLTYVRDALAKKYTFEVNSTLIYQVHARLQGSHSLLYNPNTNEITYRGKTKWFK